MSLTCGLIAVEATPDEEPGKRYHRASCELRDLC